METKQVKPSFEDRRGIIKDILVNEPIEHVTVITSKRGAVRALLVFGSGPNSRPGEGPR